MIRRARVCPKKEHETLGMETKMTKEASAENLDGRQEARLRLSFGSNTQ